MKAKTVCWFVIFLLMLNIVYAPCGTSDEPCKDNWAEFDYTNKDADLSKIPPDKVDINKVIEDPGRGKELSAQQIVVNLDKISDLTKDVDKNKAEQAIKEKYSLIVDLGDGANLKDGILMANYGNKGSVSLSQVSPTTLVKIDEKGNILLIGEKKLPEGDYTAKYDKLTEIETPDGSKINVRGDFSCKNGQCYIKKGDKSIINNIEVIAAYNGVNIYNDGKAHEGDYVSFGSKNIVMQGDNFDINFKEGNQYVNVNPAENDRFIVSPTNGGRVSIINHDSEAKAPEVIVTGKEDVSDWATIKNGKFNAIFGNEGVMKLNANDALQSDFGSVPMEIRILDENGKSLILGENGEEGKIVIDNDNNLEYTSMNADVDTNGIAGCSGSESDSDNDVTGNSVLSRYTNKLMCSVGLTSYSNSKKNELKNNLLKKYGAGTQYNIHFKDIEKWGYYEMDYISENLDKLSADAPGISQSIKTISVLDKNDFIEQCTIFATACVSSYPRGTIYLNRDYAKENTEIRISPENILYGSSPVDLKFKEDNNFGLNYLVFLHEATHLWHADNIVLENNPTEGIPEFENLERSKGKLLFNEYGDRHRSLLKKYNLDDKYQSYADSFFYKGAFDKEWYKITDEGDPSKGEDMYIHRDGYDSYVQAIKVNDFKRVEEMEIKAAKGGMSRVYGLTNIDEDVATIAESVLMTSRTFVSSFINYEYGEVAISPFIDKRNDKVKAKMRLLCKYGAFPKGGEICSQVQ